MKRTPTSSPSLATYHGPKIANAGAYSVTHAKNDQGHVHLLPHLRENKDSFKAKS
jgi:hypothetical protein